MHQDIRKKNKPTFVLSLFLILCCVSITPARADDGPHRFNAIRVEYTEHYWWMVRESDNNVDCELAVEPGLG